MRIAIDFDGVLNDYKTGEFGYDIVTLNAINGALTWLRELLTPENRVYIFSCRADTHSGTQDIEWWLTNKLGLTLYELHQLAITDKKPRADIYIDDHGFRFEGRYPSIVEMRTLSRTWLEKKTK